MNATNEQTNERRANPPPRVRACAQTSFARFLRSVLFSSDSRRPNPRFSKRLTSLKVDCDSESLASSTLSVGSRALSASRRCQSIIIVSCIFRFTHVNIRRIVTARHSSCQILIRICLCSVSGFSKARIRGCV